MRFSARVAVFGGLNGGVGMSGLGADEGILRMSRGLLAAGAAGSLVRLDAGPRILSIFLFAGT